MRSEERTRSSSSAENVEKFSGHSMGRNEECRLDEVFIKSPTHYRWISRYGIDFSFREENE